MNPNNIPDLSQFRNRTDLQLRFNDVDVLGHVNNSVYFTLYDTGKAHYLTAVQGKQVDWRNVETVIANIDCCFMNPVFYGEEIEVLTECTAIHRKSFRLMQVIREKRTGQIKSMAETVMVCFNPSTGQPHDVPEKWIADLESFEGHILRTA